MAAKTISLAFDGFWREGAISGIPAKSGVYVVHEASYDPQAKAVDLKKVIYIGEAENVNDRIANHEKWPDWKKQCETNNELCFSFAPVNDPDRERGEAALIFKHKPPINTEYKNTFPFDETTINLSGKTGLLNTGFKVLRKG